MNETLVAELAQHYDRAFDDEWQPLTGGYESDVWRVGDIVVRVSPSWRTADELRWVHDITRHCAVSIPQVVAPLATTDNHTLIYWDDRPVSVYPFVGGRIMDHANDELMKQAARLLAQIHNAGLNWPGKRPRPSRSEAAPIIPADQPDPDSIVDAALDAWESTFFSQNDLIHGPIHGDFYRANILCADGQIKGIIDWDESEIRPILTEIAWSMWELTHNRVGDDLDIDRAIQFIASYRAKSPILTDDDQAALIPVIRRHLRYEIRRSIADENRGGSPDMDYRNAEIRAFHNLYGMTI